MRILYVTPYPPLRDGIASYAVQDVARLRREGHDVEVLSPGPSAAHHHLDLRGPRGAAALGKRVRSYDLVTVQFHPDFFFRLPCSDTQRAATALALAATFRLARRVEVVVHEVDYRHGVGRTRGAVANRTLWRSVDSVLLHTAGERQQFLAAFGVRPDRVRLVDHGAAFTRYTRHDRASARQSLGLPQDRTVLLAIGFIQPHKGFDRAVRAFRGLAERGAALHVVGSLRVEDPDYVAYLEELRELVDGVPGASLEVGYVSDELFDRWLVASDVVVLPYRNIWSSGVLERAALYDRPVVVTSVGGLRDQVGDRADVTIVESDAELRVAMWRHVGGAAPTSTAPWASGGDDLREQVQAQVRAFAASRRGGSVLAAASGSVSASLSAPVRAVPGFSPPAPVSSRPGVTAVKKLVRRATRWLFDPVYWQVNALREGTIQALDEADRRERTDAEPRSTSAS